MEELKSLLERTLAGDLNAFGEVVGRFQDMAFGYASYFRCLCWFCLSWALSVREAWRP